MKYWEPLTNRDLNRLHESACGMLEDVGMRIRCPDEFSHKDIFDATGIRNAYEDPCQRAQARWQQLLRSHPSTVSASDQRTIESVVENYRQRS